MEYIRYVVISVGCGVFFFFICKPRLAMAEFVEYLILYFLFAAFVHVCVESGKTDELLIDLMKLKFEIELI